MKIENKSLLGIFIIIIGISISSIGIHQSLIKKEKQEKNIGKFFKVNQNIGSSNSQIQQKEKNEITQTNYIAVLEIPKINLKQGLFSKESINNNVEKNIQILESSSLPTIEKGNVILASHSGNSNISYFKHLDKLKINDNIYLYYKGYKYEYLLNKIYDTPKDGIVEVYRNRNKNTITLITCKKNNKRKQMVYIGYLNKKEIY